jgi:HEXXH motif-containing protein
MIACIRGAVRQRRQWLYHPFMSALTQGPDTYRFLGELNLLGWVACNTSMGPFEVDVRGSEWLVARDGSAREFSGRLSSLQLIAAVDRAPASLQPIPLVHEADKPPHPGRCCFSRQVSEIASTMSGVSRWICATTKLAAPLEAGRSDSFSSQSSPAQPGLVCLSVDGERMQTLEALVHESAHHYLFRADRARPLVTSEEALFPSPLRPDLRPMRGILLAMHACAYIAAAFREAEAAGYEHPLRCRAQRAEMLESFDEARSVVERAPSHLTPAGAAFFERTLAVAAYAGERPLVFA